MDRTARALNRVSSAARAAPLAAARVRRPGPAASRVRALLYGALACVALTASVAAAEPPAWRVSDDAGGELWLLGSVHYLREEDHPLPDIIDALYSRADVIVLELDLDDLDPAQVQTAFLGAALLPDGTTLEQRLDAPVYARAREVAGEIGVELGLLERFEPWFAALTLLEIGLVQRGIRPENGIESYLLAKAAADGKDVQGLETIDEQLAVFDGLPVAEQQGLLEQTLDEIESLSDSIEELIDAWRNGRLDALAEELGAEFERFPRLYDALVAARNRAWIDRLIAHLDAEDRRLVVVGALHLVGPNSVIELLENGGLTVTAITIAP